MRSTWEVVELQRPSNIRVAVHGSGYAMEEVARLSPVPGGTLARFVVTIRPTSVAGRLMVAMSGRIVRRDLEARARRLRAALEDGRQT